MNFSRHDLDALAGILRDAARAEILPRFRRLAPGQIRHKTGPLDLVTDADEAAEAAITTALTRRVPGALVVGEEAAGRDPTLLPRLADAPLAFVVDPVDGTANFAAGLPLFGCMAAATVDGAVVAAAIHDPIGDDVALALHGAGAWMRGPDQATQPLRVAAPAPVAAMAGTVSWRYLPERLRSTVCGNLPRLAAAWDYRCAAHEYRLLAAGACHFLLFNRLLPWDHAPGWLLHQEAGGFSAQFDGTAYRPSVTAGGLICAPDRAAFEALRAAILEP